MLSLILWSHARVWWDVGSMGKRRRGKVVHN